ncbi:MAG: GGDEF domain-containing protein [Candidatus Limnocylindria bacterium]
MHWLFESPTSRTMLVLLAIGAAVVPIGVLRAAPAADLAGAGLGWLLPLLASALMLLSSAMTVAALAESLQRGRLSSILVAGAAAAIAGGSLNVLVGAGTLVISVALAALVIVAVLVAERTPITIRGRRERLLAVGAMLLVAEGAAVVELVAGGSAWLEAAGAPILGIAAVASAVVAAASRAAVVRTAGLLAVAALALAGSRGDADLVVGMVPLVAAVLLLPARHGDRAEDSATDLDRLPPLAMHLSEGVLVFDGLLRLRSWNPAASALLGLQDDAWQMRLEDLLGITLPELPGTSETVARQTPVGGIDLTIHRAADQLTVVLHDPSVTSDAERLGRELRGTIEELLQARRTVELQRSELERAMSTDSLTGVASRPAILERLRVEVAEARRYRHPLAALMLDIDGFATINTEHGIGAGDALLREIALRMRVRVREADALGRAGSDTFLALMPHTDAAGATAFADALRRRIGERPVQFGSTPPMTFTVSIGVSVMHPGDDLDPDDLLARLVEALAGARRAGGDRVALDRLHGVARVGQAPGVSAPEIGDAASG